jgi:hypothetical protein
MALGINAVINALVSHAQSLGRFDTVHAHEPKSMPGMGLHYAVFMNNIGPARTGSGLSATTVRLELAGRVYKPFMSQPEDAIDPELVDACDALFSAYTSDFELGGNVRNVDVLGAQGSPLSARFGFTTIDKQTYRTIDIVIPLVINDAFTQSP